MPLHAHYDPQMFEVKILFIWKFNKDALN